MRGPATVKLLSPKVVRVRGTVSDICKKMSGDGDHARRQDECLQTGTSAPLKRAIGVARRAGLSATSDPCTRWLCASRLLRSSTP